MIRKLIFQLLMGLFVAFGATAQTTNPVSGKITYEGMREVDLSRARRIVNGQEVGPGSTDAPRVDSPEGVPQVMSFTQKLVFAGTMAKEERDQSQNLLHRPTVDNPGSGRGLSTRGRNLFPFEQTTFLDLANRQRIDVMTIKNDSVSQTYRTERSMPTAEGWQSTNKTKKIAGYVCYKATAVRRAGRRGGRNGDNAPTNQPEAPAETYTVWYTTDLPFTYSPVAGLTPEKGVVLQIESDTESYKATSVSMEAVVPEAVQPPKDAKAVSPDELEQIRQKEMANFRQRMINDGGRQGAPSPGRNGTGNNE